MGRAVSDIWVGVAVIPAYSQRYRGGCVQLLLSKQHRWDVPSFTPGKEGGGGVPEVLSSAVGGHEEHSTYVSELSNR